MKKVIMVISFILFCLSISFSEQIQIPKIDPGSLLYLEVTASNSMNSKPKTNFKLNFKLKNENELKYISDTDGKIQLLLSKSFIDNYIEKITYDKDKAYKVKVHIKTVTDIESVGYLKDEFSEYLIGNKNNINLSECEKILNSYQEFEISKGIKFQNKLFKELLEVYYIAETIENEDTTFNLFLFKGGTQNDFPFLILKGNQIKLEFNSKFIRELHKIYFLTDNDVNHDNLNKFINKGKEDGNWDIQWLDTTTYQKREVGIHSIYYSKNDTDKVVRLSKTLEQTSKYVNRILKDETEPVDFILKEQKFMKSKFLLLGPVEKRTFPIIWVDSILLKVSGFKPENIAYFMLYSYIVSASMQDIKYFREEHPKWASIGLISYLSFKGYIEIFDNSKILNKMKPKDLKENSSTDIKKWGSIDFKKEQTSSKKKDDDGGDKNINYMIASVIFWDEIVKEFGEDIIYEFLKNIKNSEPDMLSEDGLEKILSEICGKNITNRFNIANSKLNNFQKIFNK